MGAGPIEDAVIAAKNGETAQLPVTPADGHDRGDDSYLGVSPENKPVSTPEEDLIKAQHLFIEGLLNFLHDPTQVAKFAGEQESYIRASMKYTGTKLSQK